MPEDQSIEVSGLLAFNASFGHHLLLVPEGRYYFIHIQEADRRYLDQCVTVRGHVQGRNLLVADNIQHAV